MNRYKEKKKRHSFLNIAAVALLIVTAALYFGGCSLSVNTEDDFTTEVSLNFLRGVVKGGPVLQSAKEATPESRAIPETITRVRLTVEGQDMETIEEDIQLQESDTYTIKIPSGDSRTFTLAAFNSDDVKKYEGSVSRDLEAGDEITISIDLSFFSGDKLITDFLFATADNPVLEGWGDISGTIDQTNSTIEIPISESVDVSSIAPSITVSDGAEVEPAPGEEVDLSNGSASYIVTAEDGTTKEYTVNLNFLNSEKLITGYDLEVADNSILDPWGTISATISGSSIDLPLSAVLGLESLTPSITVSEDASVTPGSGSTVNFSDSPVTYTVTAEDGTTNTYTADVVGDTIVVPDTQNQRLVHIIDMSGTGYHVINLNELLSDIASELEASEFYPTDVAFDSQGNMYAAVSVYQNTGYGAYNYQSSIVIKVAIDGSGYEQIYPATIGSVVSGGIAGITIDRENNDMYFYEPNQLDLVRLDLTNNTSEFLNSGLSDMPKPTGIFFSSSADGDYVFLSAGTSLYRYDIVTQDVLSALWFSDSYFNYYAADIFVSGNYVYLTVAPDQYSGTADPKIVRTNLSLEQTSVSDFGTKAESEPPAEGTMYYPHRFAATFRREKLYVMDGGGQNDATGNNPEPASLIGFSYDGTSATDWETYSDGSFSFLGYLIS